MGLHGLQGLQGFNLLGWPQINESPETCGKHIQTPHVCATLRECADQSQETNSVEGIYSGMSDDFMIPKIILTGDSDFEGHVDCCPTRFFALERDGGGRD